MAERGGLQGAVLPKDLDREVERRAQEAEDRQRWEMDRYFEELLRRADAAAAATEAEERKNAERTAWWEKEENRRSDRQS